MRVIIKIFWVGCVLAGLLSLFSGCGGHRPSINWTMVKQANSIQDEGVALLNQGQYSRALAKFQQALAKHRQGGSKQSVADNLGNIGVVYTYLGKYGNAVDYYQQALAINRKYGYESGIASNLEGLGLVNIYQGQNAKAIDYFKQALLINRKLRREGKIAYNLVNIGAVYLNWGQYDKALDYFQQSLTMNRKLDREPQIAHNLRVIGSVYLGWGKYDMALDYFQQSLAKSRKLGIENEAAANLQNIGLVYYKLDQYDQAINHYQQALTINKMLGREPQIVGILNNIGAVYNAQNLYAKAMDYYQQSLAISRRLGDDSGFASSLNNIGLVSYELGQYERALDHYNQALALNKKSGDESQIALNLNNIGNVYKKSGQYDRAISYFQDATRIKEKLRKTAKGDVRRDYLASQLGTYQNLTSAYLQNNDSMGVLESIELARAKLLAERIAGIDSDLKIPTLAEIQKGLADNEAVLIFSNIDLDDFVLLLITNSNITMKEINKKNYISHVEKKYQPAVLTMLDARQGIKPGTKNNKGRTEDDDLYQAGFERSISYYRLAMTVHASHYREFSNDLYNLLFQPVADKLEGKTKLTIIPDGILGFLPFETLVDKQGRHLAEKFDLTYSQSLTISGLLAKRHYPHNRKSMLAFGGAVYDSINYINEVVQNRGQLAVLQKDVTAPHSQNRSMRTAYAQLDNAKWTNLPGTLKEVEDIANLVPGTEVITGAAVTENMVKQLSRNGQLADYKVLHFATHGLVVPEIPELSAVVLSQFQQEKNGEDGYLRMGEIAGLNIKADFINLSACETGLGKIYGGEGVVGLTQSFLIAGANGLSVSLWQVSDDSTAIFMSELYKKVNQENISYSRAIADIKRDFIKGKYGQKWQAPNFWAPFVYYGK